MYGEKREKLNTKKKKKKKKLPNTGRENPGARKRALVTEPDAHRRFFVGDAGSTRHA